MPAGRSIADLVRQTPPTRDRYVDFLRAASIIVVMLGHWLMAVVDRHNGTWAASNAIGEIGGLWLATWVFQVMPVFFVVGGFSNLVTLNAMERRGQGYADFIAGRAWRLMKPVVILLAVWLPVMTAAQAVELAGGDSLRLASTAVSQPLWFIGIYLIVTALAPPMRRLHLRFGVAVPVCLAAGATAVDAARFGLGVPMIGYLNFGFVWLYAHQLGFFYADGALARAGRSTLALGGLAGLVLLWMLTSWGPYPGSMVGLPGEPVSNMNPPTICLIALATWQTALLMLGRDLVRQWLERPRVWGGVIAANAVIMTMFLWHLTSLLLVLAIAIPAGFPQFPVGSPAWWFTRLPWVALLAATTAAFVAVFGRFERPGEPAPRRHDSVGVASAAFGVVLVIIGVCGFAVSGLVDFAAPRGRSLIGLPVSPLIDGLALATGAVLFRTSRLRVPHG